MPHYRLVLVPVTRLNLEKPRSALALINLKSVGSFYGFGAKCRNKLFDFKGWVGNLRERTSLLSSREGLDNRFISFTFAFQVTALGRNP